MQLSIPWRFGQAKPFTSIPQINWAHPLARGLVFYAYDTGAGAFLDLAGNRKANYVNATHDPVGSTKLGGATLNNTNTVYFNSDAATRIAFPYTAACLWNYLGNALPSFSCPFNRTANNGGAAPYMNWDVEGSTNAISWNVNSGGSNTGLGSSVVIQGFNSVAWLAPPGGTTAFGYLNGVQVVSGSGLNLQSANTNDAICINGRSSASVINNPTGAVFYGALWNKALLPSELFQLHLDPYCFLWYPEDDIFAELVGIVPGIVPAVFSVANVTNWRQIRIRGY